MRVLLTGGGTGGHINPALAIADTIRQNDPTAVIEFVGVEQGKEVDLVPREGYPLHFVDALGFDRDALFSISNLKALWLAWYSPRAKKTKQILKDFKPDIVIGTGGFACWPLMRAAVQMGIPTALHESNAQPGVAIKRLQKQVDRIWINFAETAERLVASDRILHVGNPLRMGFSCADKEDARRRLGLEKGQRLVLSFGGSGGAKKLSENVIDMMAIYSAKHPEILHIHAAGKRDFAECREQFERLGLNAHKNCVLMEYIYDMPIRMAAADVVISRAGAMTLSELALMQKANILIPFPFAAENHQYVNAKSQADAGASLLIEQKDLTPEKLAEELSALLENDALRTSMEQKVTAFGKRDANRLIWEDIQRILGK